MVENCLPEYFDADVVIAVKVLGNLIGFFLCYTFKTCISYVGMSKIIGHVVLQFQFFVCKLSSRQTLDIFSRSLRSAQKSYYLLKLGNEAEKTSTRKK